MGAEKRLQRKLNRMGKKKGNTVEIEDGSIEVYDFLNDNGTEGQKRRATRLYEKINKGKGITMVSPLNVKDHTNTSCWKSKVKVGTKMSSTNPGVRVNDCVDPSSPRAKNK